MKILEQIRQNKPLILNLTNSVTVIDVANAVLAVGGSPIMSAEKSEMGNLVARCSGVNLNIGTADKLQIRLMLTAGKWANRFGKKVVFDPVGCGASKYRTWAALKIVKKVRPAVIKGNMSEIKALAEGLNFSVQKKLAVKNQNISLKNQFLGGNLTLRKNAMRMVFTLVSLIWN